MKLVDLEDPNIEATLKISDLENFFDVYIDKNLNNMFNLNSTLYVKVDKSKLPKFQCDHAMHWTLISYRIYNTTRLAWLLWKLNDVKMDDVFKAKQPGEFVYYLPQAQVQSIIASINEFNE